MLAKPHVVRLEENICCFATKLKEAYRKESELYLLDIDKISNKFLISTCPLIVDVASLLPHKSNWES